MKASAFLALSTTSVSPTVAAAVARHSKYHYMLTHTVLLWFRRLPVMFWHYFMTATEKDPDDGSRERQKETHIARRRKRRRTVGGGEAQGSRKIEGKRFMWIKRGTDRRVPPPHYAYIMDLVAK